MNPARKNAAATAKLEIGCLIKSSMLAMKIPAFKIKSGTPYRLINSFIFCRMDFKKRDSKCARLQIPAARSHLCLRCDSKMFLIARNSSLMKDASQTRDFSRELDASFFLTTFSKHVKITCIKFLWRGGYLRKPKCTRVARQ